MPLQQRDPKYLDLAKRLRADVQSGHLKPGDRLPSFVELRNEYHISRGTVEKVHALLERDGLIVREQGRGVFVAQPRRPVKTGIVGFCGGGFNEARYSLFWANLMDGIQQEGAREHFQLLLMTETGDPALWSKVDGLLISVNHGDEDKILNDVPHGLPCVSLLNEVDELSHVTADDFQAAKDITNHLLALGHRKIAYLVSGRERMIERRLEGYRAALREAGIEASPQAVRQMRLGAARDSKIEFAEQGYITIRKWLESDWHALGYTAVIGQNDNVAVGAIRAFQEAGLRVPRDVSVAGFDGNEAYDYFTPKLTTVEVQAREIGAAAMRLLIRQIQGQSPAIETLQIPARLKIADSTAAAAP